MEVQHNPESLPDSDESAATVDWSLLKHEFATGSMTLADLARSYGLKEGTVRSTASRHGWQEERDRVQRIAADKAIALATAKRAEKMAEVNEQDLKVAQSVKAQIARHLKAAHEAQVTIPPKDLRSLASAAEAAQRIARLALGATTENTQLSGNAASPVSVAEVSVDDYRAALKQALDDY